MTLPERAVLYLLVQESDREFLARCLIATLAVREGFAVVIGPQWWIWNNLEALPRGVMLFKGNNAVQAANMRRARRAGHAIAAIEEEALGVVDAREIVRLYDPDIAAACDLALVQCRFQAACLENRFPGLAARVRVVGNPRIDFLRPPFDRDLRRSAVEIRRKFGPFVLLNTNFGSINPAHGGALTYYNRCVQTRIIDPESPSDIDDFFTWCRWEHDNAQALVAFARGLRAEVPEIRVILRPHPSESLTWWRDCLETSLDIEIIRRGPHLPWTIASSVMVHTGCTTGLEAAVLGATALSLTPGNNRWHAMSTSNVANPTANSADDAIARVAAHLSGRGPDLGAEMAAHDFSEFLDIAEETLAAGRVVEALVGLGAARGLAPLAGFPSLGAVMSAWQREKYTATLKDTRAVVATYASALGHPGAADSIAVDGLGDAAVVLRAA
jgi:surface carbohydrate biosynthesis protein